MTHEQALRGLRDTLSSMETLGTMDISRLEYMQRYLNLQTVLISFAKQLTERRNK